MTLGVVKAFVRKELAQILRDPRMRGITIGMPVLQLLLLVSAARLDLHQAPVALFDQDRTSSSRELTARISSSPFFEVVRDIESSTEMEDWFRKGKLAAVVEIPEGYGRELSQGRTAQVGLHVDGADATTAQQVTASLSGIIQGAGLESLAKRQRKLLGGVQIPSVELRPRVFFNPTLESKVFMVPAVLALTLFLTTIMASSNAIVKERELGTLEQLVVTPLRGWEFAVGKVAPYFLTSTLVVTLVLILAGWIYGTWCAGSLLLLYPAVWSFLLCSLGLGLLISTFATTQQQALVMASFFFMPLMIYLSGFTFPIRNMPQVLQWVTYAIPMRYFLVVLRGIFLKAATLRDLAPQWGCMLGYGVAVSGIAIWRLDRQLR